MVQYSTKMVHVQKKENRKEERYVLLVMFSWSQAYHIASYHRNLAEVAGSREVM